MAAAEPASHPRATDPTGWLERHGDALFRYAHFRLRDETFAEDLVQETLLAALEAREDYAGRSSERTWLIGILKHKIIDHFRRRNRERQEAGVEGARFEHEELFRPAGEWVGHWEADGAPVDWHSDPEELVAQSEFWEVFHSCLSPLPERIASVFLLREVDGLSSAELCQAFHVTNGNLWVMLHRARMHLRRCVEVKWFRPKAVKK